MTGRAPARSRDLAVACALAALGLAIAIVSPGGWLQAATLAPLVLLVPGYALAAALFPPGTLDHEDRVVYSFALSVSSAALGGLTLQVVLGLGRGTWLGLLIGVTLAASAVARARRNALPIQTTPTPPARPPAELLWLLAFLAALAVAGGAIVVAAHGVRQQQSEQRFASLWAVPAKASGGPARVIVGVWNHGGPASYRLKVSVGGKLIQTLRLRLHPNQRWHTTLTPRSTPGARPLRMTLFHGATAYRSVELGIGGPR